MRTTFCVAALLLHAGTSVLGTSIGPKTDNEIIAVDLSSGTLLWTYKPQELSDAHFELYPQGLIAYLSHPGSETKGRALHLDPKTGKKSRPFPGNPEELIAKSVTGLPDLELSLENGWSLFDFYPGNNRTIRFAHEGKVVWTIAVGTYPFRLRAWNNTLFFSVRNRLYAYDAGEQSPRWTLDFEQELADRAPGVGKFFSIWPQVIDDTLYVQAGLNVFALDPSTGKVLWHRDLRARTSRALDPRLRHLRRRRNDFVLPTKWKETFLYCGGETVVAFDPARDRVLWFLEARTFPHDPYPLVHDGIVFLTSGPQRRIAKKPLDRADLPELYRQLNDPVYQSSWSLLTPEIALISDTGDERSIAALEKFGRRREPWVAETPGAVVPVLPKATVPRWIGVVGGPRASRILRRLITPEGARECVQDWSSQPISRGWTQPGLAAYVRGQAARGLAYTLKPENLQLVEQYFQEEHRKERDRGSTPHFYLGLAWALVDRDILAEVGVEAFWTVEYPPPPGVRHMGPRSRMLNRYTGRYPPERLEKMYPSLREYLDTIKIDGWWPGWSALRQSPAGRSSNEQ